jgi:GxxExxY protein
MNPKVDKIKQIAKDVYRSLGSGHQECVYDKAMQVGLRLAAIKYDSQKVVELKYKEHYVGEGYSDIIVNFGRERYILELKAVGGNLGPAGENQIKTYMLINFQAPKKQGKARIEFKEVSL